MNRRGFLRRAAQSLAGIAVVASGVRLPGAASPGVPIYLAGPGWLDIELKVHDVTGVTYFSRDFLADNAINLEPILTRSLRGWA